MKTKLWLSAIIISLGDHLGSSKMFAWGRRVGGYQQ